MCVYIRASECEPSGAPIAPVGEKSSRGSVVRARASACIHYSVCFVFIFLLLLSAASQYFCNTVLPSIYIYVLARAVKS